MKFCKLIRYDFLNGILCKIYQYLIVAFGCGVAFFDFYQNAFYTCKEMGTHENATIANFFFYFFEGREAYEPTPENVFVFPAVWLLVFLFAAYITLDYPFQNLTEHGTQVIFRVGSRKLWWIAKCCWVLCSTVLFFAVIYLMAFMLCFVFRMDISLDYSNVINEEILGLTFEQSMNSGECIVILFVLPVMTALAVNLLQLYLGLFMKKIYAYMVTVTILFASTYFKMPLAVGKYAMIKRSIFYDSEGVTIKQGLLVTGIIIVLSVFLGLLRIRHYDIIKKEEGEMA